MLVLVFGLTGVASADECKVKPGTTEIDDQYIQADSTPFCCCWLNWEVTDPNITTSGSVIPGSCDCEPDFSSGWCKIKPATYDYSPIPIGIPLASNKLDEHGNLVKHLRVKTTTGVACKCFRAPGDEGTCEWGDIMERSVTDWYYDYECGECRIIET
jgi:hypothetical protein